jgi:4-amino-4-deoxy-L-arabinose transferase-like glycosyltransferase
MTSPRQVTDIAEPSPPQPEALPPEPTQPWRPPRLAWLWVLLLALAYILPGLTGHPPWTQGEARTFGVIDHMVNTGDLVVPTLDSVPLLERPPGYALSAAGAVGLSGDWLTRHDAARLATGVYLALIFVFTGLLGRRAWGPGFGNMAVLALIGSLGLLAQGHLMSPDVALAASMAMGLYGLLLASTSVVWGALWLGTGAGLGFLAQGLAGPAVLGITALVLPLFFGDWRNPRYLRALLVACVIAAPWLLAWPAALYLRDPGLVRLWWEAADPWRLLWAGGLDPTKPMALWRQILPWASFPLLPLALWALLRHPQSAFGNPGVRLALVVSTVGWGLVLAAGSERGLDALPLLVPLAVIAAGGVRSLPGWLVWVCYWLCVLVFATLALGLWGLWGFGLADGQPPQWPALGRYLPLDFRPTLDRDAALLALALTLGWLLTLMRLRPPRAAALVAWPVGLTLVWGLTCLLHLPWLNLAGSDYAVFTTLAAQVPVEARSGAACIATPQDAGDPVEATDWAQMRLPESDRVLLHTYGGMRTSTAASPAEAACDWLVLEVPGQRPLESVDLGSDWERVWEGRRRPDRPDTLLLYRRANGVGQPEPEPQVQPETEADPEIPPFPSAEPGPAPEPRAVPGPPAPPDPDPPAQPDPGPPATPGTPSQVASPHA